MRAVYKYAGDRAIFCEREQTHAADFTGWSVSFRHFDPELWARPGGLYMSRMSPGAMPKPSEQAKAAFTRLVPDEPAVAMRPMFGNLAAFVNGNMFAGLFGEDLFVRLPDDQSAPIRKQGGRDFEPMPGHAMKGYVMVPSNWSSRPAPIKGWIAASLAFTRGLPPKASTAKKTAAKKSPAKKR